MGVLCSKLRKRPSQKKPLSSQGDEGEKKQYSWEKREINREDFLAIGKSKEIIVKKPGDINGQQFIIEDCDGCGIFLCDFSETVTVDLCRGCRIFIGPCAGSVFLRECKDCQIVLACQQFRTRECTNCSILLHSATKPIIESSSKLFFGCFGSAYFEELGGLFDQANLNVFSNKWSEVYDFTPTAGAKNFSYLPKETHALFYLPEDVTGVVDESEKPRFVVPPTYGIRPLAAEEAEESALLVCKNERVPLSRLASRIEDEKIILVQALARELDAKQIAQLFSKVPNEKKTATTGAVLAECGFGGKVVGFRTAGFGSRARLEAILKDAEMRDVVLYAGLDSENVVFELTFFFEDEATAAATQFIVN